MLQATTGLDEELDKDGGPNELAPQPNMAGVIFIFIFIFIFYFIMTEGPINWFRRQVWQGVICVGTGAAAIKKAGTLATRNQT